MKKLIYKGIIFDEFVKDPDGGVWAEMCNDCAQKHGALVADELDDGGTACGCCSVEGCSNNGGDPEKLHYYIDFKLEYLEEVEA